MNTYQTNINVKIAKMFVTSSPEERLMLWKGSINATTNCPWSGQKHFLFLLFFFLKNNNLFSCVDNHINAIKLLCSVYRVLITKIPHKPKLRPS